MTLTPVQARMAQFALGSALIALGWSDFSRPVAPSGADRWARFEEGWLAGLPLDAPRAIRRASAVALILAGLAVCVDGFR